MAKRLTATQKLHRRQERKAILLQLIREIRMEGVKIKDLAADIGVIPSTMSNIATGTQSMSEAKVEEYLLKLGYERKGAKENTAG